MTWADTRRLEPESGQLCVVRMRGVFDYQYDVARFVGGWWHGRLWFGGLHTVTHWKPITDFDDVTEPRIGVSE